jgi:hypothetical protein
MTKPATVLTCCSLNHFAMALALGQSLRAWHPNLRFVIGLVDRLPPGGLPAAAAGFEVLEVNHVIAPELDEMAALYSVGTLNCALKCFFARHLFSSQADLEALVYLDADVRIYAPIDAVLALLGRKPIVLSPHRLTPQQASGDAGEETFLRTGSFNAGFFALARSNESSMFLDWMTARMRSQAGVDPLRGLFMDQKWLDLAAVCFHPHVGILDDPGCNVGYWNLCERVLSRADDGQLRVNTRHALTFYHYSGFNPDIPDRLSRYSPVSVSDRGDPLAAMVADYSTRLHALGHRQWASLPCVYDELGQRMRREAVSRLSFGGRVRHFVHGACRWLGWRLFIFGRGGEVTWKG